MLRKLWKHEWRASYRLLTALHLALLCMSVIGMGVEWGLGRDGLNGVVGGIYAMLFALVALACFVGTHFLMISRYYKNFFTAEGYLVHTLPVTTGSKLLSKYVNHMVWALLDILCIILSLMIVSAPTIIKANVQHLFELLPLLAEAIGFASVASMIGTVLLLLLVELCVIILMFYASISIGSRFPNHKILGSAGSFLIFYIASQMIAVAGMVGYLGNTLFDPALAENQERVVQISGEVLYMPPISIAERIPSFLWMVILINAGLGIVYYIVSYYILNKKLSVA